MPGCGVRAPVGPHNGFPSYFWVMGLIAEPAGNSSLWTLWTALGSMRDPSGGSSPLTSGRSSMRITKLVGINSWWCVDYAGKGYNDPNDLMCSGVPACDEESVISGRAVEGPGLPATEGACGRSGYRRGEAGGHKKQLKTGLFDH